MSDNKKDIKECIFYSEFKDHGATIPCCCFSPCDGDGYRSLSDDVDYLNEHCPCVYFVTRDQLREVLLVDGFHL